MSGVTDASESRGDPDREKAERGGRNIPDLIRYQLRDGPHASTPTTDRGEIERLAREREAAGCQACLDGTVVETRFNVVRSSMPAVMETAHQLRDYLPPQDRGGSTTQTEGSLGRAGRVGRGRGLWRPVNPL